MFAETSGDRPCGMDRRKHDEDPLRAGARDNRVSGFRRSSQRSSVPSCGKNTSMRPVRRIPGDVPPRVRWQSGFRVPYVGRRGDDFTDDVRWRPVCRRSGDGRTPVWCGAGFTDDVRWRPVCRGSGDGRTPVRCRFPRGRLRAMERRLVAQPTIRVSLLRNPYPRQGVGVSRAAPQKETLPLIR